MKNHKFLYFKFYKPRSKTWSEIHVRHVGWLSSFKMQINDLNCFMLFFLLVNITHLSESFSCSTKTSPLISWLIQLIHLFGVTFRRGEVNRVIESLFFVYDSFAFDYLMAFSLKQIAGGKCRVKATIETGKLLNKYWSSRATFLKQAS